MLMLILYHDVAIRKSPLQQQLATFCSLGIPPQTLQDAQRNDPATSAIYDQLSKSHVKSTVAKWCKQPLYRYV